MNDVVLALANPADTQAVRRIWQYCFDDSEAFVNWYFAHYYQPQNTLVVRWDNQVVASTQMIPYEMMLRKSVLKAAYVVGVATAPEARRQGFGRDMLRVCLEKMRERGQLLALLMPFEGSFYYPYGWQFCYFHLRYEIELAELKNVVRHYGQMRSASEKDIILLDEIYQAFVRDKNGYILRKAQNWQQLLADCALDNGLIYLLFNNGHPEGYVMYYFERDKIIIKEMAYCHQQAKSGLLDFLYGHRSHKSMLVWHAPIDDDTVYQLMKSKTAACLYPFLMVRIVDVAALLTSLSYPIDHQPLVVEIKDELAPWNNGCFVFAVEKGHGYVSKVSGGDGDIVLDIGALSMLVMGTMSFGELLKSGRVLVKEGVWHQWDKLWLKTVNYINEYF